MSEFIKVPVASVISDSELNTLMGILGRKEIKIALDNGGFIAGGFARALLRNDSIKQYLTDFQDRSPGDIDIFFRHKANADSAIAQLGHDFYPSQGGFAKEGTAKLLFDTEEYSSWSFKIQLVDSTDLIFPTVEETLARFDFVNCQVALVGTDLIYPREWHDLEKNMLLKIANINAPFMGSRVNKYLKQRGYKGLAPESQEIFQDWLIKAATSDFEGFDDKHKHGLEHAVKTLFSNGVVPKESLVLFLGKWKEIRTTWKYSSRSTYEVDWAHHAVVQASV
jgi:hypothetical protein